MRIEIRSGHKGRVGEQDIAIEEVIPVVELTPEGRRRELCVATARIGGEAVQLREGSVVSGKPRYVVTRVRRKGSEGLVRLRHEEDEGRFAGPLEQFRASGTPHDAGLAIAVSGVAELREILGRIDEHVDTVGHFIEPLSSAHKKLDFGKKSLVGVRASEEVVNYVDRHLALAAHLLEIAQSSTQENEAV